MPLKCHGIEIEEWNGVFQSLLFFLFFVIFEQVRTGLSREAVLTPFIMISFRTSSHVSLGFNKCLLVSVSLIVLPLAVLFTDAVACLLNHSSNFSFPNGLL